MCDSVLLGLTGCLLVIVAAFGGVFLLVTSRRNTDSSRARTVVTSKPCVGPIARLDFVQSLNPILFADAAEEEALQHVNMHLKGTLADGAVISLQMMKQWMAQSELVVTASARATRGLAAGTASTPVHQASGRLLPLLTDSKTGKTIEVMKEIGTGRKIVAGLTATSTIVVSAAHIISAADLARKIGRVDQKLDQLLAYRRIDQSAALERIYTMARELLASDLDEMRRIEIWRLRGDLHQLRATWRGELQHHLSEITHPSKDSLINWVFTRRSTYDSRITDKISVGHLRLMLIEYSLRLDRILAVASNMWDSSEATLVAELAAMGRIGDLVQEKAKLISDERRSTAQQMAAGIADLVNYYKDFVPMTNSILLQPIR